MFDLIFLFLSAFIAATIFPAQSELVLVALHQKEIHAVLLLLTIASFGNILGSCLNWILGFYFSQFQNRRWFPLSEKYMQKLTPFYQRYGAPTLLLSWVPIIGDPLTVLAGLFKLRFWLFFPIITLAKSSRYAFLLFVF